MDKKAKASLCDILGPHEPCAQQVVVPLWPTGSFSHSSHIHRSENLWWGTKRGYRHGVENFESQRRVLDGDCGDVYLDNARPYGMSERMFRSCLSNLIKRGLYEPVDGFAWGRVRKE